MKPDIQFDEAAHKYTVNGEIYPSVTQILGVLDKGSGLLWWAQKIGAQGVLHLLSIGVEFPTDDVDGAIKLLTEHKITVNHVKSSAGTRGTSLHTALEQWFLNAVVPNAISFPAEDRGYVRALARFLVQHHPDPLAVEVIVASVEYRFAGRYDLRCELDGQTALLDLKTNKGGRVYPDQHFPQLAAYEGASVEMGEAPTDGQFVLALGPDGGFSLQRSTATFDDFLNVKSAYDSIQRIKAESRKRKAAA